MYLVRVLIVHGQEPADRFAPRLAMTVNPFLPEAWAQRVEGNSDAFPDEPNAP